MFHLKAGLMKYRPRVKKYRPVQKKRRPNAYFRFKKFTVWQDQCGMKVTTDACLFGAVVVEQLSRKKPNRILDIGTGTGVLSLMLAQNTNCRIDAIEIDERAYRQASSNFVQSAWGDRMRAYHSPLQRYQPEGPDGTPKRYDLIIVNPPFFKDHMQGQTDSRNRAIHNTELPLEDLVSGVQRLISPDGIAYVLLPYYEMRNFSEMMSNVGFHETMEVPLFTQPGRPAFRTVKGFSPATQEFKHKENVVIKDPEKNYTWRFNALLKDYYLNM